MPTHNRKHILILGLVLAALIGIAPRTADGCDIPLFRYALERWEPYPYELLIFHEGDLPEALSQALDEIQERPLNLVAWLIDIHQENMHEELQKVWDREQEGATLPWGVARFPFPFRENVRDHTVWSGTLDAPTLWGLVDSPARRTVAEHILKGTSAVWIFIDGEDAEVNEAKYKVLRDRLEWIEQVAELPELALAEAERGAMSEDSEAYVPLKIDFEIVRVDPNDPAESFFVRMLRLAETEVEPEEFIGQPFAAPILGQGRAIWALIGDRIVNHMIDDACQLVLWPPDPSMIHIHHEADTAPPLHHGVDMLIQADWYGGVGNLLSIPTEAPALVGTAFTEEDLGKLAEQQADGAEPADEAEPSRHAPVGWWVAGTLAILLGIVAIASVKILSSKET